MANKNIGIWHKCNIRALKKLRKIKVLDNKDKIKFRSNLIKIGYCFPSKKKSDLFKVFKAFQMHYRQELNNGLLDKECLIIAENLSKRL